MPCPAYSKPVLVTNKIMAQAYVCHSMVFMTILEGSMMLHAQQLNSKAQPLLLVWLRAHTLRSWDHGHPHAFARLQSQPVDLLRKSCRPNWQAHFGRQQP